MKIDKVGRIVISPTYGEYLSSYVGAIDLRKKESLSIVIQQAFLSYGIKNSSSLDSIICTDERMDDFEFIKLYPYMHLWVPCTELNRDWYINNKACEYLVKVKRCVRSMPICESHNKIQRFIDTNRCVFAQIGDHFT